jgi:hypothetical protein
MPLDYELDVAVAGNARGHGHPRPAVISAAPQRARRSAIDWIETHALFVAAVAAVVVLSLAGAAAHLSQDGWLALVAGRIIAQHGIPQHDVLAVMTHGVRWVDQQWLSQLAIYGLQRFGGYALFVVAYVALTAIGLSIAVAAARALGATERHVVAVLPAAAFFYLATAVSIRTQGFGYPLFAATLWLLAAEVRKPTRRRVYLVFPLLMLWANLHGSVTMGVGLAVLYGATLLAGSVRTSGLRGLAHGRGLIFVAGAPLCLLATPYGASIVTYYHATLMNSAFGKLVTEWRPVTSVMLLAVPFLIFVAATIWLLGRAGSTTPAFDHAALLMLALGGILAVRNITWFGLGALILLPATIGQVAKRRPLAPRRRKVNLSLASTSLAVAALAVIATFAHPATWFERTYDARTVSAVARILHRDPAAKIFADVRFADWLVWHDPALGGHIAYDTSFELLTSRQLTALSTPTVARAPGTPDLVAPYSVLVLDPKNKASNRLLLARPGVRVVLRSKRVIVATKPVE